jgi:hypothetical protein
MFLMQSPSGFIRQQYLDGNFIRTALLYAVYKTQGLIADPWREDLYLGAVYDKTEKELYVYFTAAAEWEGVLRFDVPRHSTIWNLPFEYPRLNGTPEWFVVDPGQLYTVTDRSTGETLSQSGESLARGFEIAVGEMDLPRLLVISEARLTDLEQSGIDERRGQ